MLLAVWCSSTKLKTTLYVSTALAAEYLMAGMALFGVTVMWSHDVKSNHQLAFLCDLDKMSGVVQAYGLIQRMLAVLG